MGILRHLSRPWLQALVLVLAVFGLYGRTAGHAFVSVDVSAYLLDNVHVQHGFTLESLRWAWTTSYASNWHPLTWMSHMLDVQLFGLDPAGHNLESVGWHAVCSVLVLLLVRELTARPGVALFVAAAFALHPLHVESVAWIAERKDLLAGAFGLGSLLAWTRWARAGSRAAYRWSLALLALGLCSKPMLVTWPCVLLLFDLWPLRRPQLGRVELVLEKLPFFALSAASCALTWWAQSAGRAMQPLELLPLPWRLANALRSYGVYLWKTVLPFDLASFYPHPGSNIELSQVGLAAAALLVLAAAAWSTRRTAPWALVCLGFFLGTLVPVIGIVQVGGQALADRYMYLPILGLLLGAALGVDALLRFAVGLEWLERPLALLVCCALAMQCWTQIDHWKDSRALGEQELAVVGEHPWGLNLIGRQQLDEGDFAGAAKTFERSVQLQPDSANAWHMLGKACTYNGQLERAEAALRRANALDPTDPGIANHLGEVLLKTGRPEEAAALVGRALARDDLYPGAHYNLGQIHLQRGDLASARREFTRALELQPGFTPARMSLARLLLWNGEHAEALAQLDVVLRLLPGDLEARRGRARALQALGRAPEAAAELETIVSERPDWAPALADLAWILASAESAPPRDEKRALALAQKAVQLDASRTPAILDALGLALAVEGRFDEAVPAAELAVRRAQEMGEHELARRIETRLGAYRERRVETTLPR